MNEDSHLYRQWQRQVQGQRWYWGMPLEEEPPPATVPSPQMSAGCGFWLRVAAWMLDKLLLLIVVLFFWATLAITAWQFFPHSQRTVFLLSIGLLLLGKWLESAYYVLLHSHQGQTVGQAVLGLKLVDAAGDPPGLRQAVRRRRARLLSIVLLGFGYFWMLFDPDQQTMHDQIAGTYVVRA